VTGTEFLVENLYSPLDHAEFVFGPPPGKGCQLLC